MDFSPELRFSGGLPRLPSFISTETDPGGKRAEVDQAIACLTSDYLAVDHEDLVLQWVMRQSKKLHSVVLWATIRYRFLSARGLEELKTSTCIPVEATSFIVAQLVLRSQQQADPLLSSMRFGCWAAKPQTFDAFQSARDNVNLSAVLSAASSGPRHSYAFTLNVHGLNSSGLGCGIFFCWLDPLSPLSANDPCLHTMEFETGVSPHDSETSRDTTVSELFRDGAASTGPDVDSAGPPLFSPDQHPLPARYRTNIINWSSLYGQQPTVFNGAQMAAAIRQLSMQPAFRLRQPYELPSSLFCDGDSANQSTDSILIADMWDLYKYFASRGCWIQCVDMARIAILWLSGSGSCYVDTDMEVGAALLPPALTVPSPMQVARQSHADASGKASGARASEGRCCGGDEEDGCVVFMDMAPLLCIPQDADGMLQNNFLAVSCDGHPFLTLLLQAMLLSAPFESHVIQATGPALVTAMYHVFKECNVYTEGLSGKPNAVTLVPAFDVALSSLRCVLPSTDLRAPSRFAGLSMSALLQDQAQGVRAEPGTEFTAPQGAAAVRNLSSMCYGDIVHILPPACLYPRHWRGKDEQTGVKMSIGRADVPGLGLFGCDVDEETAKELERAIRERGDGRAGGSVHRYGFGPYPPASAGFGPLLSSSPTGIPGLTSATAPGSGVGVHTHPFLIGFETGSGDAGVTALSIPQPSLPTTPTPPVYGMHGWDTTWGGAGGTNHGGYNTACTNMGYAGALTGCIPNSGTDTPAGPMAVGQLPGGTEASHNDRAFATAASLFSEASDSFGVRPLAHRVVGRMASPPGGAFSPLPGLPARAALEAWAGQ